MLTDRMYLVARKWSNQELRKVGLAFTGEVANVSGWEDRDKEGGYYKNYFPGAASYTRTNYGGYRGFQGQTNEILLDLTEDLPSELYARFDVVFNHTTLEHIFDVGKAFQNLCSMARDAVIIVVPFSQVQHESESFGDYWRFTPTCIRELFRMNGMQVVYESESPHKNAAIYLFFVASKYPERYQGRLKTYQPVRRAGSWIGASLIVSGMQFMTNRTRQLLRSFGEHRRDGHL